MKSADKLIKWGLCLFIILLPWQTRWIFNEASLNGGVFEYGRLSLYGSEIILLLILLFGLIGFRRTKLFAWVTLLAVWSVLTVFWSTDKLLAWYGWLKLVEGIGLFWLISRFKSKQALTVSLIASGLIQAFLGLYQFFSQGVVQANKWLGMSEIVPWLPGPSVIEFLDQRWLRAYGSLPHPNILGGFLAVCLLVIVISLWRLNGELKNKEQVSKKQLYLNLFYWLALAIAFFGLITTFSRSAWLGFVAAFICLSIYALFKKVKELRKALIKSSIVFILLSLLFLSVFPYQLITTRIKSESRLEQKSLSERQVAYGQFNSVIKDNWYKGVGLGNYLVAVYGLQPNLAWPDYQPVHDSGLLALAELGIIGFILFILIIIHVLKRRSDYWPLVVAVLAIGLFDHYFRSLYFGMMLWWLVMGLAWRPKLD